MSRKKHTKHVRKRLGGKSNHQSHNNNNDSFANPRVMDHGATSCRGPGAQFPRHDGESYEELTTDIMDLEKNFHLAQCP